MSEVHDRLDSWKAIAEYLDRDTTTVMRWAKERGLPVHVVQGEGHRRRAVYAYKEEIDAWLKKPTPQGLHADDGKNQSEIPPLRSSQGRNDNRPADESPPAVQGDAGSANGATSRARFLAPLGMTAYEVGMTTATNGSLSSRLARRWSLWPVFVGGALLAAVAAGAWLRLPGPEPKVLGIEQLTNDGFEKQPDVVTDGARIYFIENSRDGWVIAQIPISGGSPVAIAKVNADSAIQGISPDGAELLLIQEARFRPGSVWIQPVLAGSTRRLGSIQAFSAAWSPDGAALAYTTDDGLYLCDSEGSNSRRIVAMAGKLEGVHWSPDGRQLCVARATSNETTLWVVDRDGKGLRRLFSGEEMFCRASSGFWTPDAKYFIFQARRADREESWVLRLSSGLLKRNAQATCLGPAVADLAIAAISPDCSRLYGVATAMPRFQIERFDARSKKLERFLPDLPTSTLDFTKDGQWIAYVDEHAWLWKCRYDGAEKVQLTSRPLEVQLPRWSPDGKRIAFMGRDPGRPWKVRLVSAEGGPYDPVDSTGAAEGAPTWSPDGSRLAFGGLVSAVDRAPGPLVIRVFDLKEHRLSVVPGSEGLWTARWSPDGRYIAALTEDSLSLMLFDFPDGKWTKVLTMGQILDLRWSRQGKSIYLVATALGGELALFQVRIPGQQAERLIEMVGGGLSVPLGLAPDDSPLIARRVDGAEIYALQCQFPK